MQRQVADATFRKALCVWSGSRCFRTPEREQSEGVQQSGNEQPLLVPSFFPPFLWKMKRRCFSGNRGRNIYPRLALHATNSHRNPFIATTASHNNRSVGHLRYLVLSAFARPARVRRPAVHPTLRRCSLLSVVQNKGETRNGLPGTIVLHSCTSTSTSSHTKHFERHECECCIQVILALHVWPSRRCLWHGGLDAGFPPWVRGSCILSVRLKPLPGTVCA